MNKLETSEIAKRIPDEFRSLIDYLLGEGLTKNSLEEMIASCLQVDPQSPQNSRIEIARMNLIGGLRAAGYLVTGGRAGGNLYRIVGWEEKVSKPAASTWTGDTRSVLDWVHSLPKPPVEDIFRHLARRDSQEILHENAPLYAYCYEGARDLFWLYEDGPDAVLIFQKNRELPALRIFDLFASSQFCLQLAEKLAKASIRKVPIVNVPSTSLDEYRRSGTAIASREAGIYDLKDIVNNPEKYWSEKSYNTLRKMARECTFVTDMSIDDQILVVDRWKMSEETKHRQLAITRDYKGIATPWRNKIVVGAFREGFPVAHVLYDRVAANPGVATLLNEKGLNKRVFPDGSPIPGGHSGISDFVELASCQHLVSIGVDAVNSGGYEGGGIGLSPRKKRFSCRSVKSYTVMTKFESGAPK